MTKLERVVYDKDGWSEWFIPRNNRGRALTYRIVCCDCGLAHDFEFRTTGIEVEFRMRSNERSTVRTRRYMEEKK